MNRAFWEEFFMHPSFPNYYATAQARFIENITASNLTEAVSFEVIVSDAEGIEMYSMEATSTIPMAPRSHRLKQIILKEKQPAMKAKQSVLKEK